MLFSYDIILEGPYFAGILFGWVLFLAKENPGGTRAFEKSLRQIVISVATRYMYSSRSFVMVSASSMGTVVIWLLR